MAPCARPKLDHVVIIVSQWHLKAVASTNHVKWSCTQCAPNSQTLQGLWQQLCMCRDCLWNRNVRHGRAHGMLEMGLRFKSKPRHPRLHCDIASDVILRLLLWPWEPSQKLFAYLKCVNMKQKTFLTPLVINCERINSDSFVTCLWHSCRLQCNRVRRCWAEDGTTTDVQAHLAAIRQKVW